MEPIGKSPIPVAFLILGKLALICCSLFFLIRIFNVDSMLFETSAILIIGIAIYAAGLFLITLSIINLGSSISVGLPDEMTELKTNGLYQLSRNPIYVGAFVLCAGSCLIAPHPLNFLFFIIVLIIHHQIIKKEEIFLEKRFGQGWLNYKNKVNRYFGRRKN